jgi:hypothetical protein
MEPEDGVSCLQEKARQWPFSGRYGKEKNSSPLSEMEVIPARNLVAIATELSCSRILVLQLATS